MSYDGRWYSGRVLSVKQRDDAEWFHVDLSDRRTCPNALLDKTKTELNEKLGCIQGRQGERFQVIFDDTRYGGKALKAANLRIFDDLFYSSPRWMAEILQYASVSCTVIAGLV